MQRDADSYRTGTSLYLHDPYWLGQKSDLPDLEHNTPASKQAGIVEAGTRIQITKLVATRTNPVPF